jgi:hypothetical protein
MMLSPRSMATAMSFRNQGIPLGTVIETQDGRALPITKEAIRAVAVEAMNRGTCTLNDTLVPALGSL